MTQEVKSSNEIMQIVAKMVIEAEKDVDSISPKMGMETFMEFRACPEAEVGLEEDSKGVYWNIGIPLDTLETDKENTYFFLYEALEEYRFKMLEILEKVLLEFHRNCYSQDPVSPSNPGYPLNLQYSVVHNGKYSVDLPYTVELVIRFK